MLHFLVLRFELFGVRVRRHINRGREKNHGTSKGCGKQKVVPGFFKGSSPADANVKDQNGAAGLAREHDRAGLSHVTRATRTINREGAIGALCEAARHYREAPQSAAGRTPLRRAKAQPLDDFARPLAVEGGGVHNHNAVMTMPPNDGNDNAVPKRPDDALAGGVDALRVLPSVNFVTQRWSQNANHTVHRSGDERDLHAPRPGKVRKTRVVVAGHRAGRRSSLSFASGVGWRGSGRVGSHRA